MVVDEIFDDLKKLGINNVLKNERMSKYTTFKVGGNTDILVIPESIDEIKKVLSYVKQKEIDYRVLGNCSNVVIRDEGFRGVIIKLGKEFNQITVNGNTIEAEAGAIMPVLSNVAMENGLKGLEFACGIPGSVGGAIITNIGAFKGEIGTYVEKVEYLTPDLEIKTANKEECMFGYRTSFFENKNYVILKVTLNLENGDKEEIKAKMQRFTEIRAEKQPVGSHSAGSIFKNPPDMFSAKLVEDAGLKGYTIGGAKVSEKHSGYIVNDGEATADDILKLIKFVQETVNKKFGIMLESEVKVI